MLRSAERLDEIVNMNEADKGDLEVTVYFDTPRPVLHVHTHFIDHDQYLRFPAKELKSSVPRNEFYIELEFFDQDTDAKRSILYNLQAQDVVAIVTTKSPKT